MGRKNKPLPILENVTITDVAAEGKSLARVNDMVVFVPWAVPGDVVDLQVTRKKHSFCEARIVRFIEKSPKRIEPRCAHFGVCGGCKWQNLPYEEQLKFKHKQVFDQLTRIGKVELPEFRPIMGSVHQFEYRNKLDFACSNKNWLTQEQMAQEIPFRSGIGFHISGAFDKVLPIDKCHLMDDLNNRLRNFVYQYALDHELSFFDLRKQNGLLRDIIMRNSLSGEWMVTFQFGTTNPIALEIEEGESKKEGKRNYNELVQKECQEMKHFEREKAEALLDAVHQEFPEITALLWVYNPKCNDTFYDLDVHIHYGKDHIYELMEDLRFKVGPKSFYQTNTEQAYHLYSVAREFAQLTGEELVYDLYTGTGTIANFVAKKARKVVGIEYVPEAIEDAKINSEVNNIGNTLFYAGDMKDILTDEFVAEHGRPDVIITDPPRAGMHPDVINVILNAKPKRIVYVSCNPATQARDLQLMDSDYRVAEVQPVDMFPHTPHVENVVLLERRVSK